MKRNLMAMILALCMLGTSFAGAEELLPSLVDTIGRPMPSLGEALGRYPQEEIPEVDGGNTEVFQGVTEADFKAFSAYLSEKGASLADYQTVGSSFSASIQVEGKTISFSYDTLRMEAKVTYPKGTYDEWLDYARVQYKSMVQLLNEGKTEEALAVLLSIPNYSGYRPAALCLQAHLELAAALYASYPEAHSEFATAYRQTKAASFRNVGGYVTFGSYEQDNNTANGREPIEWLVLEYDEANHCALLLSRYGLDAKPYNTDYVAVTWEKCTLRTWLNGEFINNAFSTAEQGAILTTAIDSSNSQYETGGNTNGGNNTQDTVFLLSYAEADKYLGPIWEYSNNMKCRTSPTPYAQKAGAWTSDTCKTAEDYAAGWWWMRSDDYPQKNAAIVSSSGSLHSSIIYRDSGCVRPALWINLESDIF